MACLAACAAATTAAAQAPALASSASGPASDSARALVDAAFAKPASGDLSSFAAAPGSTFAVRAEPVAAGVFAAPAVTGTRLDQPSLLATDRYIPGEGLVRWRTGETLLDAGGGAVDAVRFSVGGIARGPLGAEASDEAFDLTYTRGWVSAVRGSLDGTPFDITPRAGVGVSNAGGSAIAGAVFRLGDIGEDVEDRVKDRLSSMVSDGSRFGDRGRWYIFAAADGRAVGLNIARNENGWSRQGLTTDEAAVIGEAQVGVGWRKGAMQASFGVIHREMKTKPAQGLDEYQIEDQAVAFTLSIKPGER
jgi:hypothetical protein